MFETCQDHDFRPEQYFQTRRQFLNRFGMGIGALGLASLFGPQLIFPQSVQAAGDFSSLTPKVPPFPAKAKHVVHIFAQGAPSHIDTFDPKPELAKYDGQPLPGISGVAMQSPFTFEKKGKSGIEVSEVFPNIGEHVDDMAIIRSMWTDIPAHEVATVMMNTGSLRIAKPCLGSWVVYGFRESKYARIHIAASRRWFAAWRLPELAVRFPAGSLSGYQRQYPGTFG